MPVSAPRFDEDDGFTVLELAIAMALTMLVMAALLGVLVSQTNAEKRVSTFAENQELLRQAIVLMQRDIRSSEPLEELASVADYATRIDLIVYDDIDAANPTPIRWRVDTTADVLVREILDGAGNVVAEAHRVEGVVNDDANPLFEYYSPGAATPYALNGPNAALSGDIAQCTIRVHITLVGAPNPGPEPATLASDAQLRNRLPGGLGCSEAGVVL